jgi:hypothetical protein
MSWIVSKARYGFTAPVVDLARLAALEHEAHLGARAFTDQVVVHAGHGEQRGDRRQLRADPAVGQDEDVDALVHGVRGAAAGLLQGPLEPPPALVGAEENRQRHGLEGPGPRAAFRGLQRPQLLELFVGEDRGGQLDLVGGERRRAEEVALGADRRVRRHDQLLPDGVDRRVRDLREELLEVVVEQLRLVGKHRQRRVVAHRPDRLDGVACHRGEDLLEVLAGVAERQLPLEHRVVVDAVRVGPLGHVLQRDQVVAEPQAVGPLGGRTQLDLLVRDDPALLGVDQEHAAGLQPALLQHAVGRDLQHADLGREHHEAVLGHVVARRP